MARFERTCYLVRMHDRGWMAPGVSSGILLAMLLISGCRSPFAPPGDDLLMRSVDAAVARELAGSPEIGVDRTIFRVPSAVEEQLEPRREELDALGPQFDASPDAELSMMLGPDLDGNAQQRVNINLQWAIEQAVQNNLGIQAARLQPAINEADVVAAEAVFDAVLFSNFDFDKIDEPGAVPLLMGIPLGAGVRQTESTRFETGVRRDLVSGGSVSVSTELNRTRNKSPGFMLVPDPQYLSSVRLGFDQPLLRGFGSEVNTAEIRLNQNQLRRSVNDLHTDLLDLVDETEDAYWDLAFAWADVFIRQWLIDVGVEVRDVLEIRLDLDVTPAVYSDAVATVEQRKSELISARRSLRAASDRLKVLLNDPGLPVGSEVLLAPLDLPLDASVGYNLSDAIRTGVANRPEVRAAILGIDDASIRQTLADNARLPLLNLSAELAYFGLDADAADSYGNLGDGNFIDYVLGLAFEYPIGNRGPEAGFRRARLQRSQSVIRYRQTVQAVVADVKSALRDVVTTYELIGASRSTRVAQAENLRTLMVEEETVADLTPEFLNLKFNRQEGLALARREEVLSLVTYNKSLAELYRSMGTGLERNQIKLEIVDPDDDSGAGDAARR